MSDQQKTHISSVIKAICRERHWSQADFARHAGIGQDVVSAWVRQKVSPSIKMIAKVAAALGENVDRFLPPETPHKATPIGRISYADRREPSDMKLDFPADRPGFAHIELSADVPSDAALKIAEIINSVVTVKKSRPSS